MSSEKEIKDTELEAEEEIKEEEAAPEEEKKGAKKAKTSKLEKEIEELKAKNEELNDRYLRMLAEYDNFRKRAAKEKEGVYADAYGDVIKEILPVIDNLERAVAFPDSAKVVDGVNMTLNQFKASLEKLGIEEVPAEVGGAFDPNIHNAVMHVEDETLGENVITDVFQKGYKKGDRVIRHPMVKVAN